MDTVFSNMKRVLILAACSLPLSSCDKAREIAGKAKTAVENRVEEVKEDVTGQAPAAEAAAPADANLQSLVDQTEDGYVFRKDLPYPTRLKVKVTESTRFKGRHFESSLFGAGVGTIDGEFQSGQELEMQGGTVAVTFQEYAFVPAVIPTAGEAVETRKVLRKGGRLDLVRKDLKWAPAGNTRDFSVLAMMANTDADLELSRDCVMPRPFWFGKGRMKIGDEVAVSDPHLGMLGFRGGKGRIRLRLDAVEAVGGHPCGVFSVAGAVDKGKLRLLGESAGDEQVTIESGKIWCSLIYPVVLKEELEMVITAKQGEGRKLSNHMQGSASVRVDRAWTVLPPPGS